MPKTKKVFLLCSWRLFHSLFAPAPLSLSLSYMLDVSDKANAAYDGAYSIAKEHLDALHPVLLGLALNYSVFHYEIEGDVTKAIELAKQVYSNNF